MYFRFYGYVIFSYGGMTLAQQHPCCYIFECGLTPIAASYWLCPAVIEEMAGAKTRGVLRARASAGAEYACTISLLRQAVYRPDVKEVLDREINN